MWTSQDLNIDSRLIVLLKTVQSLYEDNAAAPYEHGLTHIGRVVDNILSIFKITSVGNVETTLVLAAGLCHDVGYLESRDDHVNHSITLSRDILHRCDFKNSEIDQIASIIGHHSFKSPPSQTKSLDSILLVADKCDMLGLDGSLRQLLIHRGDFGNRDLLCHYILRESQLLYVKLISFEVGIELIEQRWQETKILLETCLSRGFMDDSPTSN